MYRHGARSASPKTGRPERPDVFAVTQSLSFSIFLSRTFTNTSCVRIFHIYPPGRRFFFLFLLPSLQIYYTDAVAARGAQKRIFTRVRFIILRVQRFPLHYRRRIRFHNFRTAHGENRYFSFRVIFFVADIARQTAKNHGSSTAVRNSKTWLTSDFRRRTPPVCTGCSTK